MKPLTPNGALAKAIDATADAHNSEVFISPSFMRSVRRKLRRLGFDVVALKKPAKKRAS